MTKTFHQSAGGWLPLACCWREFSQCTVGGSSISSVVEKLEVEGVTTELLKTQRPSCGPRFTARQLRKSTTAEPPRHTGKGALQTPGVLEYGFWRRLHYFTSKMRGRRSFVGFYVECFVEGWVLQDSIRILNVHASGGSVRPFGNSATAKLSLTGMTRKASCLVLYQGQSISMSH